MALAAALAGGAVSALGSVFGGREASKGAEAGIKLEKIRMRQLKPYIEAGKEALPEFRAGIEDIPTIEGAIRAAQSDPSFDFMRQQGLEAIEGSAFARGKGLSGDTAQAVTQYGQDFANTKLNEILNRALTLQGTKQNQLSTLLQGGLSAAGRQSALPQLAMQQGQIGQQTITGVGNAINSTISNLALMNALKGAGQSAPLGDFNVNPNMAGIV